jgi:hypothetical protein
VSGKRAFAAGALFAAFALVFPLSALARPSGKLVPQTGVLVGAAVNLTYPAWRSDAQIEADFEQREATLGRRLAIAHHYRGWTSVFPTGLESGDLAMGRIPLISWAGDKGFPDLGEVMAGSYDGMIRDRARGLRDLGEPVFLRFGWEMNGSWSGFGGLADSTQWPALYVAAWRHIHDLFVEEGAENVVWVWSPAARSVPARPWNHWSHYYPGDAYVDWVGIDGYNWGTLWRSFSAIFTPVYRAYAARKPLMIAEVGSVEAGGDKAAWIDRMARDLRRDFPSVAGLVWFDSNTIDEVTLDTSESALDAYRRLGAASYFDPLVGNHAPVTFVAPGPGARRVPFDASIQAYTRSPLDCSTVSGATVTIEPATAVSPACSDNLIGLNNDVLVPGTWYTVTITPEVHDTAGSALPATSWSFRAQPPRVKPIARPRVRLLHHPELHGRWSWTKRLRVRLRIFNATSVRLKVVGPRGSARRLLRILTLPDGTRRVVKARSFTYDVSGRGHLRTRLEVPLRGLRAGVRYRIVAFASFGESRGVRVVRFRG